MWFSVCHCVCSDSLPVLLCGFKTGFYKKIPHDRLRSLGWAGSRVYGRHSGMHYLQINWSRNMLSSLWKHFFGYSHHDINGCGDVKTFNLSRIQYRPCVISADLMWIFLYLSPRLRRCGVSVSPRQYCRPTALARLHCDTACHRLPHSAICQGCPLSGTRVRFLCVYRSV